MYFWCSSALLKGWLHLASWNYFGLAVSRTVHAESKSTHHWRIISMLKSCLVCPLASGVSPCHVVCVTSLLRPRCTSCNAGLQTLQDYNKLQGLIGQIGQFTNSSKGKVPLQQGHSLLRSAGWRNTKRVGATGRGGASWGDPLWSKHKNLVSLADSRRKNSEKHVRVFDHRLQNATKQVRHSFYEWNQHESATFSCLLFEHLMTLGVLQFLDRITRLANAYTAYTTRSNFFQILFVRTIWSICVGIYVCLCTVYIHTFHYIPLRYILYYIIYYITLYYIILYIILYIKLYYIILYVILLYYIIYYIICYFIILYHIILYYNILYYIIYVILLYHIISYYIILCYVILYYVILYYTILYYAMLYYIMLYYIILCYVILYYVILYYTI